MYLGVDYYPEHWPEKYITRDLDRISDLGANMVRIGEFAWHLLEPIEGSYDFSFFEKVVHEVNKRGMKVMFGTPTATFPAWLAKKYPGILSEGIDGTIRSFGGRRQYCYSSQVYREYAARISEKLVAHFSAEDGILAWQIDNEIGHEGSDMCYCKECHLAFILWLKDKYGSIDQLNNTWGTIFWGMTYNAFDEIPVPKTTITVHNPSFLLDWMRFRSYILNSFVTEMVHVVIESKGEHQQVTTNASGGFFNKNFDHDIHFRHLDFTSYDHYPVWGGLEKPQEPHCIGFNLDLVRGIRQENFWIVEQLIGAQGHDVIGYLPRPGQAIMWAHQAMAHGCQHMLWFRWRSMTKGAEQFCYGILDHDDQPRRKYDEVKEYISFIQKYEDVLSVDISAEVALLYDYDNVWAWKIQSQSISFSYFNQCSDLYKPFFEKNVPVDIIQYHKDWSRYKIIVLPHAMILDDDMLEKLVNYVNQGGYLITSYRSGIKDEDNNMRFGANEQHLFYSLIGAKISESESLGKNNSVEILFENKSYHGEVWRDMLEVTTATSIATYNDVFSHYSSIIYNEYGKGKVIYIGTSIDSELMQIIINKSMGEQNIFSVDSPEGLETYPRIYDGKKYLFVMNHTDRAIPYKEAVISPYGYQVLVD